MKEKDKLTKIELPKRKEKPDKYIAINLDYGTDEGIQFVTLKELKEMLDSIDNCECKGCKR